MGEGDFTEQAEAYSRSRPGYPAPLLERLVARAGVTAGDAVVELGAGTGIFTRLLSARGLAVTALEPNAAMRALAPELPGVDRRAGTFERTGLPEGSQRWAVAAQAFHWADPPSALPELRRVLAPGAWLTVLWNDRRNDACPVTSWMERAIHRHAPDWDEAYRDRDWSAVLRSTGDFDAVERDELDHVVPMPRARFVALWRSHNRLKAAIGEEGLATLLAELEEYLDAERIELIELPYRTRAWSARRA